MGLTSKVLNAIVEDVSQLFDLLLDSRKTTAKASLVCATSIPFRSEHPADRCASCGFAFKFVRVMKEIAQKDLPTDDHNSFPKLRLTREEPVSGCATLGTGKRKPDGSTILARRQRARLGRVATGIANAPRI